jgi:lipopolysaccharide export system permease protein
MRTLYTYLTKQILATTILSVAVFAFVLLLGNIMKEILALLINGQASFTLVGKAFLLLVPFVMVFALPMGMLTASLLLFGRLSADQELTAMRAGGISLASLSAPIIIISMVMSMLCAWINLDLAPYCRATYKDLIRQVDVGTLTDLLQPGIPMTDIPGQMIHIEGRRAAGDLVLLENIHYIQYEGKYPVREVLAPGGTLESNDSANQIFLTMTNCTVFYRNNRASPITTPSSNELDSTAWTLIKIPDWAPPPFTIERHAATLRKPKLHHMSFRQLKTEMKERMALVNEMRALPSFNIANMRTELEESIRKPFDPITPVKVQMHRQFAFSYACFAFTLVGIPLGIQAHRRETSTGIAMALILVALYYGFIVLANALEDQSQWFPHLIMWLPNFLFQSIGCVLMWRANRGI